MQTIKTFYFNYIAEVTYKFETKYSRMDQEKVVKYNH